MKRHADEVLGVVQRARTVEVRVVRRTFNGVEFVDLRKYVARAGGAPAPTTTGVTIRLEEVEAVVAALQKAKPVAPAPPQTMLDYDMDHPLKTDDCERCGLHWSACTCGSP